MKKLVTLAVLLISISGFSQENDFWENVRFGGGIGLGFGSNSTTISVSPTAIYDFNEQFSLGAGVGYQYSKRGDFKSNVFSGSIVSLYNPINAIQLSAEFEHLFVNQTFNNAETSYNYPALYIGGAYRVSRNVSLGIRYDVLYDENKSIYASAITPIIRVFF